MTLRHPDPARLRRSAEGTARNDENHHMFGHFHLGQWGVPSLVTLSRGYRIQPKKIQANACERSGHWQQALAVLARMGSIRLELDTWSHQGLQIFPANPLMVAELCSVQVL